MEFKTIKIEAISIKNNGIKPEKEKWITIHGKATEYLKELKKGQTITLGFDNGKAVFIKQAKNLKVESADKQEKNEYWERKEKRDIETNKWLKQQGVLNLTLQMFKIKEFKDFNLDDLFGTAKLIFQKMSNGELEK